MDQYFKVGELPISSRVKGFSRGQIAKKEYQKVHDRVHDKGQQFEDESTVVLHNNIRESYNNKRNHLQQSYPHPPRLNRHTVHLCSPPGFNQYTGEYYQSTQGNIRKKNEDVRLIESGDRIILGLNSPKYRMSHGDNIENRPTSPPLGSQIYKLERIATDGQQVIDPVESTDFNSMRAEDFDERQRQRLKNMIGLLESRCAEAEKRNEQLCVYIRKKDDRPRRSGEARQIFNNIRIILEDFFFKMTEQFLAEKMFTLQRKVKQIDSRLKTIIFRISNFKQEKNEHRHVCKNYSYKTSLDEISLENKTRRSDSTTCHNIKCVEEIFEKQNVIEKLREEIECLKSNEEEIAQSKSQLQRQYTNKEKDLLERIKSLEDDIKNRESSMIEQQKMLLKQKEQLNLKLQKSYKDAVEWAQKMHKYENNVRDLQQKLTKKDNQIREATAKVYKMECQMLFNSNSGSNSSPTKIPSVKNMKIEKQFSSHLKLQNKQSEINIYFEQSSEFSQIHTPGIKRPESNLQIDGSRQFRQLCLARELDIRVVSQSRKTEEKACEADQYEEEYRQEVRKLKQINFRLEEQNRRLTFQHQITQKQLSNTSFEYQITQNELSKLQKRLNTATQSITQLQNELQNTHSNKDKNSKNFLKASKSIEISYLPSPDQSESQTCVLNVHSLKFRVKQLQNEIQMLKLQGKDDKDNQQYRIHEVQVQLDQKIQQLLKALKQNNELKSQIDELRAQYEQNTNRQAEKRPQLNLRNCMISEIESQTPRDSMSFRLSFDNSICVRDFVEQSVESNVSNMFKNQQFLQKQLNQGKTSRRRQVRLFQKTSAYVKSLKQTIITKDARIYFLEQQIQHLKKLCGKQAGKSQENPDFKQKDLSFLSEPEAATEQFDLQIKDSASVQIQRSSLNSGSLARRVMAQKEYLAEQNTALRKEITLMNNVILSLRNQITNIKEQGGKCISNEQANQEFQTPLQVQLKSRQIKNIFSSMHANQLIESLCQYVGKKKVNDVPQLARQVQLNQNESNEKGSVEGVN